MGHDDDKFGDAFDWGQFDILINGIPKNETVLVRSVLHTPYKHAVYRQESTGFLFFERPLTSPKQVAEDVSFQEESGYIIKSA